LSETKGKTDCSQFFHSRHLVAGQLPELYITENFDTVQAIIPYYIVLRFAPQLPDTVRISQQSRNRLRQQGLANPVCHKIHCWQKLLLIV